ncbi:MAG: NAD-dependent epimerase/dehydratase family protein [Wenzhouxiangella sp.]|nr:MAG: NAD-dependent epimerase/dehydratase family protein [Wenzhouxiangella sp.]
MTINSLLVFGATGTQGHPVVDAALEADLVVRAATRDIDAAEEKLSSRVDIVEADLHDGEAVAAAMDGVDAVFFHLPILPSAAETPVIVANVIEAARVTGIQRIVFSTSGYCGDDMPPGDFVGGLRRVTQTFLASGLDTVVLRPTLYLANLVWPNIIRDIRDYGRLCYPPLSEKRRLNWTATEDQGKLAVACLDIADSGEIIDIASPEPVTGPELCQMLAGVYGREVHYAPLSTDEFAEMLSHMASSAEVGRTVAGLYEGISALPGDGPLIDTDALEARFGVRLTPVSEWVEERLGALLDLYG